MAKKKNSKIKGRKKDVETEEEVWERWHLGLEDGTKRSIMAIFSVILSLFFTLSAFGEAGLIGDTLYNIFHQLFGVGFFFVPIIFLIIAVAFIKEIRPNIITSTIVGSTLFLMSGLGIIELLTETEKTGGYIGYFVSLPLVKLFDLWVGLAILIALFISSLLIILNTSLRLNFEWKWPWSHDEEDEDEEVEYENDERAEEDDEEEETNSLDGQAKKKSLKDKIKSVTKESVSRQTKKDDEGELDLNTNQKYDHSNFTPPPFDLLSSDKGKPSSGDLKSNATIIKRTLQNFGVEVELDGVSVGPSITQYAFRPAEGVKVSRITALQNDLCLALAAHPLRIEAPIPGKSAVGIEMPNKSKTIVGLRNMLEERERRDSNPLSLGLGKDVSGSHVFSDLAKMPHLLIAGTTGAGKSICVHSIIINMLYRNAPENLRFIMVDPKKVELTVYNNLPHMLTPAIINPKKTVLALKWAVKEMDRRYEVLLKAGVRDIDSYHKKGSPIEPMPYLVIVIDELADLMSTYPREIEASIVRLAQMSRAVGIHLIVSTQRPSVEVITGLIKANISNRIALQVSSQIDSRTILDMAGAEKLLGKGDMLFLSRDSAKPVRLQSPFVSEKELERVVSYIAEEYKNVDIDLEDGQPEMNLDSNSEEGGKSQSSLNIDFDNVENEMDDGLYEEARQTVIEAGKASTSFLQRKLKVGYSRAARLMDMLEEQGVVGPADGSRAREILIVSETVEGEELDGKMGEEDEKEEEE